MPQINLRVTPAFEGNLRRLMRSRHLRTKSEAIRCAVEEAVARASGQETGTDFTAWLGQAARPPVNPRPRFASDDDMWEKA